MQLSLPSRDSWWQFAATAPGLEISLDDKLSLASLQELDNLENKNMMQIV